MKSHCLHNFVALSFAVSTILFASTSSADISVFADDFDGGQTTSSGVTAAFSGITNIESVQGYAGIGPGSNQFSGNFLRNQTGGLPSIGTPGSMTTLTLSNLPAHTSIDIDFLLATIDTWDGIDGLSGATGDYFNIRVDGVEVFEATFAQLSGSPINAYQAPPGGQLTIGSNHIGTPIQDGGYDMGLEPLLSNIPHTSATLVIDFFADGPGWQGDRDYFNYDSDESWAIENLRITVAQIPEPSSTGCLIALVVCGIARRTRQL